jgi:hypothetical protein
MARRQLDPHITRDPEAGSRQREGRGVAWGVVVTLEGEGKRGRREPCVAGWLRRVVEGVRRLGGWVGGAGGGE